MYYQISKNKEKDKRQKKDIHSHLPSLFVQYGGHRCKSICKDERGWRISKKQVHHINGLNGNVLLNIKE
jgi:hypothetical protein